MEKTKVTIGQLINACNLPGGTDVVINDSGEIVYSGMIYYMETKYFERNIKNMYISHNVLYLDIAFDY